MAAENSDLPSLKSQLSKTNETWIHEIESHQHLVRTLKEKLMEITASTQRSKEDGEKVLDVLMRRVKTTTTLLTYLKSKARLMALPELAQTSCCVEELDGTDEDTCSKLDTRQDSYDQKDEAACIREVLQSIHMVTDVMETLVKRVILAESKTAIEKEKVWKKTVEINHLYTELEEVGMLYQRSLEETMQMEDEKMQKESEAQKLMEENVKLTAQLDLKEAQLDLKEAQLMAMNEQCKELALGFSRV